MEERTLNERDFALPQLSARHVVAHLVARGITEKSPEAPLAANAVVLAQALDHASARGSAAAAAAAAKELRETLAALDVVVGGHDETEDPFDALVRQMTAEDHR